MLDLIDPRAEKKERKFRKPLREPHQVIRCYPGTTI